MSWPEATFMAGEISGFAGVVLGLWAFLAGLFIGLAGMMLGFWLAGGLK